MAKDEEYSDDIGFDFGPSKGVEPSISTSKEVEEEIGFDFGPVVEPAQPKKEAVTPIAEKVTEEPAVVAQNQAPIEEESQEAQSFQSVLPSQESGLDSQLKEDDLGVSGEDFSRYLNPTHFNNIKDERVALQKELSETEAKKAEDPMGIKKGEEVYNQLQEALKPKLSTEKDIEATLKEIEDDVNISEQEKEAAREIALQGKQDLLDNYEAEKQKGLENVLKGHVSAIERDARGDYESYITNSKNEVAKGSFVSKEAKEEYGFNKKLAKATSKESILGALATTTTPNNAYVKLAAINKSENKAEEIAAYKKDLLDQIAKDNKVLGNRLTDTDLKRFAMRSVEEVAAIAGSLSEKMNEVNSLQAEKQVFLDKKHDSVNEEISDLKAKLVKENESLTVAEKKVITDLIDKRERSVGAFFEEDGAKTADLVFDDVKEGTEKYNLYREILKDIPENLSSKEKFDVFYLALKEATMNSLLAADLLDAETGEYDATIENTFRDFLGIESVLGVDFSGEILGSLTPMEIDAMQMKGDMDDLTNIFLNNTAYASPNYWDELMNSFAGHLVPNMARASGKQSDTTKSAELVGTLGEYGIAEGEGVLKENLEAWTDLVATPEKGVTWQKFAGTTGGSFAMMVHLMGGTGVLKSMKVGKIAKALTKVEKVLNKSKAGKLLFSGLQAGVNADVSGRIFNDREELEFKQFAVGEIGSKAFENLLKAGGMKYVPMFIKGMGLTSKAALDFATKIATRSAAEITEESIQSIVGAYNSSDSLKGMSEELKKQFPDMDAVTEFAILTGLSGGIFGIQGAYSDVRKKLVEGGYDMEKADGIMDKVAKEYRKAAGEVDKGVKTEEGTFTKVTDKKSPVKGGDTFNVSVTSSDGREVVNESYKINKIDKDFNVHVTVDSDQEKTVNLNGEDKVHTTLSRDERVLTKEEFSELRKNQSFELFRESKAPVEVVTDRSTDESVEAKDTKGGVTEDAVTEPTAEVVIEPAEVTIDDSGESKYTNKEGKFYLKEEVAKMTPEQLSNMVIKNPNAAVQANLDKAAGVTEEVVEEVVPEAVESEVETTETTPEVTETVAETETAGETKEEVKTEQETKAEAKKLKAEAKQAKADAKLEAAKKAESRNNSLVREVVNYNEMTDAKKKSKEGQALLAKIQKMSGEQKRTISQDGKKIKVTDSDGKKIKESNEFSPKDVNEWVSQEVSSTDETWAEREVNNGLLDGDATTGRIHLAGLRSTGLSAGDIKAGVKQIKKGNLTSVSARRVIAGLADARKKGVFEISDGKGGLTALLINEVSTRELTEEEVLSEEEMNAEMEAKAEEQSQAQKIKDNTDSFVEAVRKLKIKLPGDMKATIGVDLVWNAAVEIMAKSIYAGGSTAAAVAEGLAHIKKSDWYKKKLPAERKKIKEKINPALIKASEDINELAKIEKAKVEGTKKEAREAKKKERKKEKKGIKDELDEAYDALHEVRDDLSQGKPSDTKKLNKHIETLLTSPNISADVKNKLKINDSIRYTAISNKWSQDQAIQLVQAFSQIEGGLELLLADVEGNFLKYGQVGVWIMDGAALLYQSEGRVNDATDVNIRKTKIAEILGRSFQALGITAPDNIMDAMVYTAFTETVMIQDRVKSHRDSLIADKQGKDEVASKETLDEARTELTDEVGDISSHPQFKDAVDKAIEEHIKKEKAAKKTAQEKTDKKNSFSTKRAELKAKRKQIKKDFKEGGKNIFFSSVIPMLTPEGIEYAGDIAKTYVQSGMLKVSQVASALKEYFKKEHGRDLSDSDILKVLNNVDVEKEIQDNKDDSSKKLADKIIDYVSQKKNKKTGDAVDVLIRNLFAKAKDSLPTQGELESDTDYRNKLIKAMQEQTFAKEVWDSSRNTIVDILNNKEANGIISGGEKGKILKDLESLFGDEVGMPFSKSLLDSSLKEQIKSDGEKINDIVAEHYSAVKKNGKGIDTVKEKARSLAEKIVADTDLTPTQADELAASLEKQFGKLIEPYARKALAKVLGVPDLTDEALNEVLKSDKVTVENIIKAINMGALTEDAFLDAFATRFGFASLTGTDAQKLNAFIYDISHLPERSVARDKAFINFRTYMNSLEADNKNWLERYYHGVITSYFYQHILGTASTTLRSVYGLTWGGGLQLLTEFLKNPKLFTKGLRAMFTKEGNLHGKTFQNFRVMSSILKGFKNLGPDIIKDAWKEGYIPYESALEGAKEANTSLGVLDQLANAEWKDLSTAKKIAKLYETPGSKMLRLLFASDAVAHYSVRQGHVVIGAYNKILREGNYSSTKTKEFWEELDRRTGNTDAARKTAELQVDLELAKLKAAGVDTKNFRKKQRVQEVIFDLLEDDIKVQAEQKSMEMRLGHHPKGSFGFVYDKLSTFLSNVPLAMFVIPFLKIPLNLADAATDYVPVLGLKKALFGRGNVMKAMNKTSFGSTYVSDELVKKSVAGKEFIAENRMDYLVKQGIGTAAAGALIYAVTSTFDLPDDDEDKRIEITYKGKGSFEDNQKLEDEKGLKQFHFRFKYPGTNQWSGWIDYRDSPLGPTLAFAGGMSDKLKYDREDYNTVVTNEEMWDAVDVAKMNALFFFKEQNFLQAVGDVFKIINNEETAGNKTKKYIADQIVRGAKGVAMPSFYSQAYSWKTSLFNEFKKANVDIKDSDWALSYMADKISTNVPFLDHLKEDYKDNLGQKVRVSNKIPLTSDDILKSFQDIVGIDSDKSNSWNYLMSGTNLKKNDIVPDFTKGKKFVYVSNDKKEIPTEVRDSFKEEYDSRVLAEYIKEFKGDEGKTLMKDLKKDDAKYKVYLQKLRKSVKDEMLYGEKSKWRKITYK
jgi:hypothetical protein